MLNSFDKCEVILEALSGAELQHKLTAANQEQPDIILLDVNMPGADGVVTAKWIHTNFPAIKVSALSMNDSDKSIISMLQAGCCAYLLKDMNPTDLETALEEIYKKGYYNADASNINFRRLIIAKQEEEKLNITEKEQRFLHFACSDLTYKQIAGEMNLSERTIDGYREALFAKLNVQSRVGLALEAIRRGIVRI
jgi:DNA-binding NarL/FixJ family response regulator